MRPSDVLKMRRDLLDTAEDILASYTSDDDRPIRDTYEAAAVALPVAQAYYVSADMTSLMKVAASDLPVEQFIDGDQPSDVGIIAFDSPVGLAEARYAGSGTIAGIIMRLEGAIWGFTRRHPIWEEGDGARIMGPPDGQPQEDWDRPPDYYADALTIIPIATVVGGDLDGQQSLIGRITWWSMDGLDEAVVDEETIVDAFDPQAVVRMIRATWVLMGQSLTTTGPGLVERAERRRNERANLPSDVLVVMLRRIHQSQHDHGDQAQVDYSHRWLVAGHWRNQWLPSRGTHRLQWIAPYVKGPEDKPLVVKERVSAWVR